VARPTPPTLIEKRSKNRVALPIEKVILAHAVKHSTHGALGGRRADAQRAPGQFGRGAGPVGFGIGNRWSALCAGAAIGS